MLAAVRAVVSLVICALNLRLGTSSGPTGAPYFRLSRFAWLRRTCVLVWPWMCERLASANCEATAARSTEGGVAFSEPTAPEGETAGAFELRVGFVAPAR